MLILVTIIHFALAILLFYLINWMGKYAEPMGYMQMSVAVREDTAPLFNYLFKVLAPVVYIVLLTAIFQKFGWYQLTERIYVVVIEYWAFRLLYVILLGHTKLLNWMTQVIYWVSSIGLALWFQSVTNKVDSILPDPKSLLEELWILIIVFIYTVINKLNFSTEGTVRRKENYLRSSFCKLRDRYGAIVDRYCDDGFIKVVTYSIMIYENFNRPALARSLERFLFRKSDKIHSYGIMQVCASHILSDEESIELGVEKIRKAELDCLNDEHRCHYVVYNIAQQYNGGDAKYAGEVDQIYEFLIGNFFPNVKCPN